MRMRNILIIEDDHVQHTWLSDTLSLTFPDLEVEVIETESEFIENFQRLEANPPTIIIIDIMLRWTNPSPSMPVPPVRKTPSFYEAGLRCYDLIKNSPNMLNTSVIFYSVLGEEDLSSLFKSVGGNIIHLKKETETSPLLNQIKRLLN